jgi:hypothetical protein
LSVRSIAPLAFALVLVAGSAQAGPLAPVLEVTAGPGWRVALGEDARAPGFEAVTGGVDLLAGIEILQTLGIVIGARVRSGLSDGNGYLEVAGDFGLQLRLGDRVRARLGFDGGRAWITGGNDSPLFGGFAALGFDLFASPRGVAATLIVRLDGGGFTADNDRFPEWTMALCAGVGGRY